MMAEFEPGKFRRGESTGKPLGGNVSMEPFPQALYNLAISRGYESQKAFAKALGVRYSTAGTWYRGKITPNPDCMGAILVLLQPNDEESDSLLNPYGQLLEEKPVKQSLLKLKPGTSPFDKWVEKYCQDHGLTLTDLAKLLKFNCRSTIRNHDKTSLDTFSQVLQKGPEALNLSEKETGDLSDAVATTIEQQIAAGRRYGGQNHLLAGILQKQYPCITYTPIEAAKILGITREGVRYLRDRFNLPLLLTEAQLDMLMNRNSAEERS